MKHSVSLCALCAGLLFSATCIAKTPANKLPTLLILDTEGKTRYYYHATETLAKSAGFAVDYKNLYQWLEEPSLEHYQSVMCSLSGPFLVHKDTSLLGTLLYALRDFCARPKTNLILLLPAGNSKPEKIVPAIEQVATWLGILDFTKPSPTASTTRAFLNFCMQPDSKVGFTYNSTLINKTSPTIEQWKDPISDDEKNSEQQEYSLKILPLSQEGFSAKASLFLPAGLLLQNAQHKTNTLLAKESVFTFAEVAENFFRCPINFEERNELLSIAQKLLIDFYHASFPSQTHKPKPTLPEHFSPTYLLQEKIRAERAIYSKAPAYRWITSGDCSAGWLAPDDYHLSSEKFQGISEEEIYALKKQALQNGVAFLYDAGINLLWFELNAENFLSTLSRTPEKEKALRDLFQPIVDEIRLQAHTNGKPLPKVFIGTDITCSFRTMPTKTSVIDLFGKNYSKIPSPLERATYWQQELLDVFDAFCDLFQKTIPIDGIFLDFEMYHAQDQAGGYDDLMDFSDSSWQVFCKEHSNARALTSTNERVDFLLNNKLFATYFKSLEHEARTIGTMIKNHLRTRIPNLMIGAYATTLPGSWFYRGMFAGLSDAEHPLILATFNMDAYSHRAWMNGHGIHYLHGVPLLLSKLAKPDDLSLIDYLTNYHSFIWFSRPSRIVYDFEKHKDDWWSVEASPLDAQTLAAAMQRGRTPHNPLQ